MSRVLVVGSGAGGVNAAWPLVERGHEVTLVDYGNVDRGYASLIPARPWSELRASDPNQHRYLLGDDFEGIPLGPVRVGAQLTPPRLYITADTERLTPVESSTFSVSESLARGGLASGWGAGVFPFDEVDFADMPISHADVAPHYEAVAERIGVAGGRDDLLPLLGDCSSMMPGLEPDTGAECVLRRYEARRGELNPRGFFLGNSRLAACTREHRGRGPHRYHDTAFWADPDRSVYRPRWTLDELAERESFRLVDRRFALSFREDAQGVVLVTRHADTGEREEHRADALVLAAGTLGTSRIVLRSLDAYDRPIPVLCNPYTYAPAANLGMLGREPRDARHSLSQLTALYHPEGGPRSIIQYYSYRSLLTFKLMKETPLAHRYSRAIMRRLQPILGILGIQHEDRPTAAKRATLRRGASDGEPDRLEIHYEPTPEELARQSEDERAIFGFFRRLGCWALKRVHPGHGSAIHYAGTLPMATDGRELTCDAACRLSGTRRVHLADGSVFPVLPAKGLTFTIMANADRVGTLLADELER